MKNVLCFFVCGQTLPVSYMTDRRKIIYILEESTKQWQHGYSA